MFGPDRCGSDSKLHFIFRHVNPKNKTIEEKHCKKLDTKERSVFEELFKDNRPHLFRLIINPDNSFEISVDHKVIQHISKKLPLSLFFEYKWDFSLYRTSLIIIQLNIFLDCKSRKSFKWFYACSQSSRRNWRY